MLLLLLIECRLPDDQCEVCTGVLETAVVAGAGLDARPEVAAPEGAAQHEADAGSYVGRVLGRKEGLRVEAEGAADQVRKGFAVAGLEEGKILWEDPMLQQVGRGEVGHQQDERG